MKHNNMKIWMKKCPDEENVDTVIEFNMTKDYVKTIMRYYNNYRTNALNAKK